MGALTHLRNRVARFIAPRNQPITTSAQLADLLWRNGYESEGGEVVTATRAMQLSDVHACVRVLSEDIASLPLILYKRLPRGKDRLTDHWLFSLLQRPNRWQTGFEFRELQQLHLELRGNFFALQTVLRGEITELLPVSPDRVTVVQDPRTTAVIYTVNMPDGTTLTVPAERMYHLRGPSMDGIVGLSPIEYHRQTIGMGLQMGKYGNQLFKNGAMIGGTLEHPGEMSAEALTRFKDSFDEQYSGVSNAFKTVLLEEGAKFTPTAMKAEEAQFLESRKYTRTQICGVFRVPPHMIADLERATFANIEEQGLSYVQGGLVPRLRRIEARALLSLVPLAERKDLFLEHLVDGLLRGRVETRWNVYQKAVQTGVMTRNEVREKENMNPGPAKLDEFLDPAFLTGSNPAPSSADPTTDTADTQNNAPKLVA